MKCLECKKDLEQTPGKRTKQFCNSTCRSNYWQKSKRKVKEAANKKDKGWVLKFAKAAYKEINKKESGSDLAKKAANISYKAPEQSSYDSERISNLLLDEAGQMPKIPVKPKNLMELKAMCPFPEGSDERRTWISTERQKYGI